jgi:hypothetical protein
VDVIRGTGLIGGSIVIDVTMRIDDPHDRTITDMLMNEGEALL